MGDVVAAHVAHAFFADPSADRFDQMRAAARKARVEPGVRAAARAFLETGEWPYRLAGPVRPPGWSPRGSAVRSSRSSRELAADPLTVDPGWPLPVPDSFAPLMAHRRRSDPGPRFDVLIDMAVAENDPAAVLRWYDKLRAQVPSYPAAAYADRVAKAVTATHPQRAFDIYQAALAALLPHARPSAYEAVVGYLKKLRPVYDALGRGGEWIAQVTGVREKYRNRRRLVALLDGLDTNDVRSAPAFRK